MSIHPKTKSLSARQSELQDTFIQLQVLNGQRMTNLNLPSFAGMLGKYGHQPLKPAVLEIFQVNVGKLCNQACAHCHVDAGPDKKLENMTRPTMERCLEVIAAGSSIHTVDITGGAPEMHPHFRWFVSEARKLGKKVIDRCNLTILVSHPKYADLPAFLAANEVQVVSSLPHFNRIRTDSQRGDGVFEDSIKALRLLNAQGYGKEGSPLQLHLVCNPTGAFLPAGQTLLEAEFKRQLKRQFDIEFNHLYSITNMPISRFLDYLLESGNYTEYMEKLVAAFNPATINGLMCRNTISVSWDGYLYDCDFNQMLQLKANLPDSTHIRQFDWQAWHNRNIVVNQHCYGCTAGAGSGCGGEVLPTMSDG